MHFAFSWGYCLSGQEQTAQKTNYKKFPIAYEKKHYAFKMFAPENENLFVVGNGDILIKKKGKKNKGS